MRILEVNLNNREIKTFESKDNERTGRGLANSLVIDGVAINTDYMEEANYLVLAPGLLTGTQAPSTGRLTISAKGGKNQGIKSINIAGPLSQKIASLGYEAIIISGANKEEEPAVLHISEDNIILHFIKDLKYKPVEDTIDYLVDKWGKDTSILGIGPAGEHLLPISSVFSTYPEGSPKFYCSRGKMGDLFGYKGLKAIAVTTKKHFSSDVYNKDEFRRLSKELSRIIIEHPVCGGALPAYGSITLIKMMKDKEGFLKELQSKPIHKAEGPSENYQDGKDQVRINKNCAPNCVIGCLNRHKGNSGSIAYSSPAESEALAACESLFNIDDHNFVSSFNKKCFQLGIDTIEFLFSCSMLLKSLREEASEDVLMGLLEEVEGLTPLGRIAASTTKGIYSLYSEYRELEKMITLPAATEEASFNITVGNKVKECNSISDLEYLYGSMTAMGNLGICLFATFAILDDEKGLDILAKLVSAKLGHQVTPYDIISSALENLQQEKEYETSSRASDISNGIPEFVKVLYRYFAS